MFFSPDPDMLKAVERLLASDNEPAKVLMGAMTKMTPEQWQKMGEVLQILNAEQQALSSTGKQKPAE